MLDDAIVISAIAADGSVYPIEKMAAHRGGGVRHLAVSVFVFDGDALLIQRRAAGKYHSAGQWANACCSHPHWNETPADAAARRLQEELGVALPLTPTAVLDYDADVSDDLREVERVHVFRADADSKMLRIAADPQEVSETRWADVAALRAEARANPDRFAAWFRIYLERWAELGFTP
jgi:isopentenyl-diphosphate delta-isomerase